MAQFDLAAAMGLHTVSKMDTAAKLLELALLDPHPDNFFTVEKDITDLAESIALNGLLQPLIVAPAGNGRYRVIAGHRRRMALLKLAESDPEKYKYVSCIERHPVSPESEMLMLIQTNTESRELGWSEKARAAAQVEKILIKMQQEQGIQLPGKMRTHIAKVIKTSESQLARANFIAKNLIGEAKKAGVSDSAAYAMAHLTEEQQRQLFNHYKGALWRIDQSSIKRYRENIASGRDPFYVLPEGKNKSLRDCYILPKKGGHYGKCTHYKTIEAHAATKNSEELPCTGKNGCCAYCVSRFSCEDLCPAARNDVQKIMQSENYIINQRLRDARMAAGISFSDACRHQGIQPKDLLQRETTSNLPVTLLCELCRLYGCTPNQILGFEDTPGGGDKG